MNALARQVFRRIGHFILPGIMLAVLILANIQTAHAIETTPLTVTIWDVEQLGSSFDLTTLGDFFARISINGIMYETNRAEYINPFEGYIIPTSNLLSEPWTYTHPVSWPNSIAHVHIEIWDDDEPDSDDQADINPTSELDLDLDVDVNTGKWTGDVNWPVSCIAGPFDLDNNPHSVRICFDINTISESGDIDEDGLLDNWEMKGINYDNDDTIDVDLPRFGASPWRKDVFVEVDCVVALDHTHCPTQDAIYDVVKAFAMAPVPNLDGSIGVQLHLDVGQQYGISPGGSYLVTGQIGSAGTYGNFGGGGDQIPEALGNQIIESFSAPKGNGVPFADLKLAYFDNRRAPFVHYAIFGHQTNARSATNDCTSGEADEIPGHDFFVTLGGSPVGVPTFPCWGADANGLSVGTTLEQAGTFMHELGHTLGLDHGGFEGGFQGYHDTKPNYLSVMSYRTGWQMCGVPASPSNPALAPGGCDYSRIELPPLNENITPDGTDKGLDECLGFDGGLLGFGPQNWDKDLLNGLPVLEGITNCQPPNNANVKADIDGDGLFTELKGYDDWGNLNYIDGLGGAGGGVPVENEADPQTIEEGREFMAETFAPGVVVDKTGPATAVPGDVLNYTVDITNQGPGPALHAVLTDTAPDGTSQSEDLGVLVVGSVTTRNSSFTVPEDACPGDFTGVSATVDFEDIVGNALTASDTAPLEIKDVAAPILDVSVSPSILWSPDHKFYEVTATITVTDNCDPNPTVTLLAITSNEPATGFLGNGDQGPDIQGASFGTDDRLFSLRAERGTGGLNTGRVYTIRYSATDESGNTTETIAIVTVPTNNSKIH